ncbi:MAG: chaperone modulator CbpM [Betaproteobacteria bacterium]|nr:chaperone modulator CbpM [Betaproteobacteria bacterium]MDH5221805.1 chaperone modulator CbpM [Betaproteobacteria bacterium]MDH5349215.1 chaperone modulator CbpM [Betaproteobacteria bacterium]
MSDDELITLEELTVVCAVSAEWVRERVAEGLLPERFDTLAVRRVRRMRSLERDFDAAPELAALVADLLEELDALRAHLR